MTFGSVSCVSVNDHMKPRQEVYHFVMKRGAGRRPGAVPSTFTGPGEQGTVPATPACRGTDPLLNGCS